MKECRRWKPRLTGGRSSARRATDGGRSLLRRRGLGGVDYLSWFPVAVAASCIVWILLIALVLRGAARERARTRRLWKRNGDDLQKIMAGVDEMIRLLEARGPGSQAALPCKSK